MAGNGDSTVSVAATELAMASSLATVVPTPLSASLAYRPRSACCCTSRKATFTLGDVQILREGNEGTGGDDGNASASRDGSAEFQELSGVKFCRRGAMAAAAASAMLCFAVEDSRAADSGGLLSKYLKRKKLDPLDTYVPTVVLAQLQFQDVGGKLVEEKPEFLDVRSMLRSGPAGSLRTDIRAVAQYAAEAGYGKDANEAIDQCLSALEDLDSLLLRASRDGGSAPLDIMKTRVSTAVTALDKLLATVPSSILEKGKAIATAYRDQSTPGKDDNLGYDESPDQLKGLL